MKTKKSKPKSKAKCEHKVFIKDPDLLPELYCVPCRELFRAKWVKVGKVGKT